MTIETRDKAMRSFARACRIFDPGLTIFIGALIHVATDADRRE